MPLPAEPADAIEEYFSRVGNESFVIDEDVEIVMPEANRWMLIDDDGEQVGPLYKDYDACCVDAETNCRIVGVAI